VVDTLPAATQPPAPQSASTGPDKQLITESIEAVFVSGDPGKACEQNVTAAYVAKTYGDLDGCRKAQVPGAAASSVDVSGVRVSGDRATADARPQGGPSGGELVHVTLFHDAATWRVDALESDAPVGP
jgi:hypothetical protein